LYPKGCDLPPPFFPSKTSSIKKNANPIKFRVELFFDLTNLSFLIKVNPQVILNAFYKHFGSNADIHIKFVSTSDGITKSSHIHLQRWLDESNQFYVEKKTPSRYQQKENIVDHKLALTINRAMRRSSRRRMDTYVFIFSGDGNPDSKGMSIFKSVINGINHKKTHVVVFGQPKSMSSAYVRLAQRKKIGLVGITRDMFCSASASKSKVFMNLLSNLRLMGYKSIVGISQKKKRRHRTKLISEFDTRLKRSKRYKKLR